MNPSRRFERYARLSYDATNERIRIIEEEQIGTEREYYDELFLHREVSDRFKTKIMARFPGLRDNA